MESKRTPDEIMRLLKRPWPTDQVKSRKGPAGKMLSYVDARQVMARLDEVVGPEGWQTHYSEVAGNCCCTLSIKMGDEWVAKSDGAGETSIEGEKGQFSDAFKRAAVSFGVARYLYLGGNLMSPEEYDKRVAKRSTSVAGTVVEQEGITVDQEVFSQYVSQLTAAFEMEDQMSAKQLWTEVKQDGDMYVCLMAKLPSKIKTFAKRSCET